MIGWILAIILSFSINLFLGVTVLIVALIWNGFIFIAKYYPQAQIVKSELLNPLVINFKIKKLAKEATKSDIEGRVNKTVHVLRDELPAGWIRDIKIKWVRSESQQELMDDKQWVIRMRPYEDQAENFVTAVYYFFKKCLYPNNKKTIPELPREVSSLFLCQRVIELNKDRYKSVFENYILEPAVIKNEKVLDYLDLYRSINSRGLFTSVYLREINEIATKVRFTPLRKQFNEEIAGILKHLKSLVRQMPPDDRALIAEEDWKHKGPTTHYGFILIADLSKTKREGAVPYVKRAKTAVEKGVERLYLLGRSDQNLFTQTVINAIQQEVLDFKLVEKFHLSYDYKGNKGGYGALFEVHN